MPVQPAYRDVVDLYARVSTVELAKKNVSHAKQLKLMRREIKSLGMREGVALEETYSAGTRYRPELDQLMDRVRAGVVGAIMVSHADRFSRDQIDTNVLLDTLREHGVALLSASERLDSRKIGGVMQWGLYGTFAENDRRRIFDRTMGDRLERAQAGEAPNNLPKRIYGYRKIARAHKYAPFTWQTDEHEAEVVRQMFADKKAGKTLWQIADDLTASGEPTPSGQPGAQWRASTISRMLSDTIYIGVYMAFTRKPDPRSLATFVGTAWADWHERDGKPIPIRGVFPAIVDEETFAAVKRMSAENCEKAKRNQKHDYLLAKRFRCSCGRLMTGSRVKRGERVYTYYRCTSYSHSANGCGAPHYRMDDVDEAVWAGIKERFRDNSVMRHELEHIRMQQRLDVRTRDIERMERRRDELGETIDHVVALSVNAKLPPRILERYIDEIAEKEDERVRLDERIAVERARVPLDILTPAKIEEIVSFCGGDLDVMLAAAGKTHADGMALADVRVEADPEHEQLRISIYRGEAFPISFCRPWTTESNRKMPPPFSLSFVVPFATRRSARRVSEGMRGRVYKK